MWRDPWSTFQQSYCQRYFMVWYVLCTYDILKTIINNQNRLYFFRQKLQSHNYLTSHLLTINLTYNMIRPMKYLSADRLPKVFQGLIAIIYIWYGSLNIVPTIPGLLVSQTWQYQGQIEKMAVPMVFSY
jgi:hypothetical protein